MIGDKEITEEMIEGIWAENQYKIENIEGYAAAFERLTNLIKFDRKPNKQDKEALARAFAELMFIEIMHRYKP